MTLPSQLLAGPGREQEPETCNNSVPRIGSRSLAGGHYARYDVCGFDLATCDRCGRTDCPECDNWPADGDDDKTMCRECRRITNEQRSAQSDNAERLAYMTEQLKVIRRYAIEGRDKGVMTPLALQILLGRIETRANMGLEESA